MLKERAPRPFSIGVAALVDDLADEPGARGWVGSSSDLVRAARLKEELAFQQARAGELAAALETGEGLARIYRRLLRPGSPRYRAELALALSAIGQWATRLGRRDRAVSALADAAGLYRDLLDRCGRYRAMRVIQLRVGLAVTLSNLGLAHCDLGEHAQARAAAEESVWLLRRLRARNPLYRLLARSEPTRFEHCMAALLNNLGVVLAAQGELEDACRLAEECAAIYRRLAALAPVVFESELARALHNLGLASAQVGRLDAALASTQEAVYLHRCLMPADRLGHQQHLGQALCAFAQVRVACSRDLGEALAAAQEAVGLHEELAARNPEAFSGDLHAAYRTVNQVRTALDRSPDSDGYQG